MATFGLEKVLRGLPEYKSKISSDVDPVEEYEPIGDVLKSSLYQFESLIGQARVFGFSKEQTSAIPPLSDDEFASISHTLNIPFDVCYMDLAYPDGQPLSASVDWGDHQGEEGFICGLNVYGALLYLEGESIKAIPVYSISVVGTDNPSRILLTGIFDISDHKLNVAPDFEKDTKHISVMGKAIIHLIIQNLHFMQSANVYLGDASLSRQQRKQLKKDDKPIPLETKIKQSKPYKSNSSSNSQIDFSYRFEVRGHYKHFSEGTRIAQANVDRMINIPGKGNVVRIWCPPFVKGPSDKPLVIKNRSVI